MRISKHANFKDKTLSSCEQKKRWQQSFNRKKMSPFSKAKYFSLPASFQGMSYCKFFFRLIAQFFSILSFFVLWDTAFKPKRLTAAFQQDNMKRFYYKVLCFQNSKGNLFAVRQRIILMESIILLSVSNKNNSFSNRQTLIFLQKYSTKETNTCVSKHLKIKILNSSFVDDL